ncbi:MAG: hypothetical protein KTR19_12030 [Hyphomicrobiales bacterium]|nr:hypothetical protein [Hyphomicrobiales bacterium]
MPLPAAASGLWARFKDDSSTFSAVVDQPGNVRILAEKMITLVPVNGILYDVAAGQTAER